ncbi:prokaryotic phospholipase A2-domain-containing protein [Tricharina praecox]|uniref:prokaryotic phospholipase A2-domain-containing protein n=1 Tax=Tricharina praecox TaxID=43433 RepID=UPI00221E7D00|nr:prokaryotic phospholipase A2-domain-containing protein [Tricharina praecox]KAI5854687.1 prokaryotic phospholipase A2-domain-containing protein [Tricharina praecox]
MHFIVPLPLLLSFITLAVSLVLPRTTTSSTSTLEATTDRLIFSTPLATFLTSKTTLSTTTTTPSETFDWSTDGCSSPLKSNGGFNFVDSCTRHDFGYRNYKLQGRFSEAARKRIDGVFRQDLEDECRKLGFMRFLRCQRLAEVYYTSVRRFGDVETEGVQGLEDVVGLVGDVLDRRAVEVEGEKGEIAVEKSVV